MLCITDIGLVNVVSDCVVCGRFNGVVRLREKAPDAITSYMISAFAIDDLYGLGVTERPTKVCFCGREVNKVCLCACK